MCVALLHITCNTKHTQVCATRSGKSTVAESNKILMSSPAAATQNKVVKSLLRIDINIYIIYTLYTHTYVYMYSGTGYDLWHQAGRLT